MTMVFYYFWKVDWVVISDGLSQNLQVSYPIFKKKKQNSEECYVYKINI